MPFRARNCRYLRLSALTTIPLYLYLDDRHIEWMSDRILQAVISDLRPLIPPKLKAESDAYLGPASGAPANAKRGTVDVYRGDSYQFAYFFRKAEPHGVVLKTRYFVAKQPHPENVVQTTEAPPEKRKRSSEETEGRVPRKKGKGKDPSTRKNPIGQGRSHKPKSAKEAEAVQSSEEDEDTGQPSSNKAVNRRSTRTIGQPARGSYREDSDSDVESDSAMDIQATTTSRDVEMFERPSLNDSVLSSDPTPVIKVENSEESYVVPADALEQPFSAGKDKPKLDPLIDVDEDEQKPKPALELKYQSFNIHDRCVCVVVEPWPVFPTSRATSIQPPERRELSIAPPEFVASDGSSNAREQRAQTPLFLPDPDRGRSATPMPSLPRTYPPVPLFNEVPKPHEEDDDGLGMFELSQILNSAAGERSTAVDEDDEIDGAVLFGDADERKML